MNLSELFQKHDFMQLISFCSGSSSSQTFFIVVSSSSADEYFSVHNVHVIFLSILCRIKIGTSCWPWYDFNLDCIEDIESCLCFMNRNIALLKYKDVVTEPSSFFSNVSLHPAYRCNEQHWNGHSWWKMAASHRQILLHTSHCFAAWYK